MNIVEAVKSIKLEVSAEQMREKIVSDLGLQEKNKKYLCFLHNESTPSMGFDEVRKRFKCFSCGQTYDIFDHYMQYYNNSFVEAVRSIISEFSLNIDLGKPKGIKRKTEPIKHDSEVMGGALEYIKARGITEKTIKYVGVAQDNNNIVFEYKDFKGEHIANKYRPAKKLGEKELKTWFQKGTNLNTLYNMDKINITEPLVICEGEFDCLSLIEAGYKNAVSVPTGASSEEWIEVCWDWLEQFEEIIVWFDNDDAGKAGASRVASRLPNNSVKITACKTCNDINELLFREGAKSIMDTLKEAQEIEIPNVITMDKVENFDVYKAEKIKSGIPFLDKSIYGFIMGSLVVITGYNGGGKSTLVNQMCIAEPLSQGFKSFVFSPELNQAMFKSWLHKTIANPVDLKEYSTMDGTVYYQVTEQGNKAIEEWIADKFYLYNSIDNSEDTLLKTMEIMAKRKGVRCFVVDNLTKVELNNASDFNLNTPQKKFTDRLKAFAVKYKAVVYLIAHPKKPNEKDAKLTKWDISGTADISNLADYVLGIHRATQKEKDAYEAYKMAVENGKPPKERVIDPRDASILLFKDRPTGSSDKECRLYFSNDRRRFYSSESYLDKNYGYAINEQQELEDMPF